MHAPPSFYQGWGSGWIEFLGAFKDTFNLVVLRNKLAHCKFLCWMHEINTHPVCEKCSVLTYLVSSCFEVFKWTFHESIWFAHYFCDYSSMCFSKNGCVSKFQQTTYLFKPLKQCASVFFFSSRCSMYGTFVAVSACQLHQKVGRNICLSPIIIMASGGFGPWKVRFEAKWSFCSFSTFTSAEKSIAVFSV